MAEALVPGGVHPPFGRYSHGIAVPAEDQAVLCFEAIGRILAEGGMDFGHIVRLNAFVTRREDFPAYMAVRDRYVRAPLPASTLVIVTGFTRPEFKVEVEATAAKMP
jgi:2-iminobutanoate/2-iminopropanoate deaminase